MPSGQPTLPRPEAPVRNESLEPPGDSGLIGMRVSRFGPACQVENAVEDIKGMLGLLAGPLQQGVRVRTEQFPVMRPDGGQVPAYFGPRDVVVADAVFPGIRVRRARRPGKAG